MTGKKEEISAADVFIWIIGMRKVGVSFDAKSLDRAKQRFDRGDKSALLDAVYAWMSSTSHKPDAVPEWIRVAFMNAFAKVRISHEYKSWDDAFGPPLKKNEKLACKAGRSFKAAAKVWVRVAELRRETPRRNVFPEVAKEFGISVAEARKYFYAASKLVLWKLGNHACRTGTAGGNHAVTGSRGWQSQTSVYKVSKIRPSWNR